MNRLSTILFVSMLLIFSGLIISCEQEGILNEDEINDSTANSNEKKEIALSISPSKVSVEISKSYQFTSAVSNSSDQSVSWKVLETGGGTVTNTGNYTAPNKKGTYHLLVISMADNTKTDTAEITVTSNVFDAEARAKVLKDYQDNYLDLALSSTQIKWTGNEENCQPGDTDPKVKELVLKRVNYFRRLAGLPDNIVMNSEKSRKCQEAALMILANRSANHFPPKSWKCYTDDGALAAGKSNITLGVPGPKAITAYMNDHGLENAGHRRWILYPKLKEVGTGDTGASNALWVIGDEYKNYPDNMPEFISWPPPGYVPQPLAFYRWSFSIPNANFKNAKVQVKKPDGTALNVKVEDLEDGYGENTLVWMISGITWFYDIGDEMVFDVTVSNVGIGGEIKNYSYKVVIFMVI